MKLGYSKKFLKQLKKSPKKIQVSFAKRLRIFINNPNDNILRNHALIGKMSGLFSINITGDWRVIYKKYNGDGDIEFILIGTHSQLYK